MILDTDSVVQDARPPARVLRIVNPIVGPLLHTPLSRMMKTLAVVEFAGRRTGQRRRVVVGWHNVDGVPVVVTPAPWRANFTAPRPASVRCRGRGARYVGTLMTDPDVVADIVNTLIRTGTSARSLALRIPRDHTITAQDVTNTRRAVIRFALD